MVGTHDLTERLEWNAIHNSIIIKITYIHKNALHITKLVNSAHYTTYLNHIISTRLQLFDSKQNSHTWGKNIKEGG